MEVDVTVKVPGFAQKALLLSTAAHSDPTFLLTIAIPEFGTKAACGAAWSHGAFVCSAYRVNRTTNVSSLTRRLIEVYVALSFVSC